ncbi:MAG: amidohydrolase family protein [Pseudomonadales bacterium]
MIETPPESLVLRDVVCYPNTTRSDVLIRNGQIESVAPSRDRLEWSHQSIDGRGAVLLPGLNDHHVHLLALAASRHSVDLSGARDLGSVRGALRRAPGTDLDWIRATGYHESSAGLLDRRRLDELVTNRPLRVQHASGKAWFFNSAALRRLRVLDGERNTSEALELYPAGLELDSSGAPTGRLFRGDDWLRARLSSAVAPDLAAVAQDLIQLGVTGLTDASADNDDSQAAIFAHAMDSGVFPQQLRLMGGPKLTHDRLHRQIALGERKFLLDDDALPDVETLVAATRAAWAQGRGTAWHCVSRAELLYALYVLEASGPPPAGIRDRIEHAGVVPPECLPALVRRSLTVVTQPLFIAARGDRYLEQADPEDRPWLYRLQTLRQAGIPLGLSSDAPYASPDPWAGMRAAVERRTLSGRLVGRDEALTPEQALRGYLSPLDHPGGSARRIAPGVSADLCLLDRPWSEARRDLQAGLVRAVLVSGQVRYLREP